MGGGILTLR